MIHGTNANPHTNGDCRTLQKFIATSDITGFVKSITDITINRAKSESKRKRESYSGKDNTALKSQKTKKPKGEGPKPHEKGKPDPSVNDKLKVIELPNPDPTPTDITPRPSTTSKEEAMTISHSSTKLRDLAQRIMEEGVVVSDSVRTSNKSQTEGLLDSGASRCMSPKLEHFDMNKLELVTDQFVYLADNYPVPIKGIGPIRIRLANGSEFWIEKGLWVPDLEQALISVSDLIEGSNDLIIMGDKKVHMYLNRTDQLIEIGHRIGNLYYIRISYVSNKTNGYIANTIRVNISKGPSKRIPYLIWHFRLGHMAYNGVCVTLRAANIHFDFSKDSTECMICQLTNLRRRTVKSTEKPATRYLECLCEDTFPLEHPLNSGEKYCTFIVDQYSRKTWLRYCFRKSDAPQLVMDLIRTLETRNPNNPIVEMQSDNGELNCESFRVFCEEHKPCRIRLRFSPPHNQAFNGFAEAHIGRTRAVAASFLTQARLPPSFMNYALDYAAYIRDYRIVNKFKKTTIELSGGNAPSPADYDWLQLFGCLVAIHVPKELRHKRVPAYHKAEPGLFLGYRGSRIVLVYKFRTGKVTGEYHVRYSTIFPGLRIRDSHINPLLSNNREDDSPIVPRGEELVNSMDESNTNDSHETSRLPDDEGETRIDFVDDEDGLPDGEWSPDGDIEVEETREGPYNQLLLLSNTEIT